MEISREINKHLAWIEDIASLFGKDAITDEKVDELSQHTNCSLGQWLDSKESTEFQALAEFSELKESHEAFHKLAGELIKAIETGKEAEALTSYQQFIDKSQNVISCLKMIREKIAGNP